MASDSPAETRKTAVQARRLALALDAIEAQLDGLELARAYIGGAAVNGKLYAVGGDTWDTSTRTLSPVANVEMLDLTQPSPTWVSVAPLPAPRGDLGAWGYDSSSPYEIAGKVLAAGGNYPEPSANTYLYDPGSNTWSSSLPNMVHATRNFARAQLNGYLYAFGGYDYSNGTPNGANFNQRYDATGPGATPTPTGTGTPPTSTPTPVTTNTPTVTHTPTIGASPTPCAVQTVLTEGFEGGNLGQFTSTVGICNPGGCGWVPRNTPPPHSGTWQAFAPDLDDITDQYLTNITAISIPVGSTNAELTFWHTYDMENTFDGGVLETSTNGGTSWQDAGALITQGGYDTTISTLYESPIGGRMAWTNQQLTWEQVRVNLTSFIGQSNLKIRFRQANDNSVSDVGWWVDDVVVTTSGACTTTPTVPPTNTNTPVPSSPTPAPNTSTPVPNTPTAMATETTQPTNTPGTPGATNTPGTPVATPTACTLEFADVPVTNTFYPFVR